MNWNGAIALWLAFWVVSGALASDNDSDVAVASDTLSRNISMPQVHLDSKLRTALLKALTDLENEKTEDDDSDDDEERIVEKAQASAITIVEDDFSDSPSSAEVDKEEKLTDEAPRSSSVSDEASNEKAHSIFVQKSQSLQTAPITSLEHGPLDPLKEAENIITSASNSFREGQNEPRSIAKDDQLQKDTFAASMNSIFDNKSEKLALVGQSPDGKTVREPPFIKTYIKPLDLAENMNPEAGDSEDELETTTRKAIEISTEENEAKVEQVQFFSAPLVAAFTVHQDESGHPKKVEPIYKSDIDDKPVIQTTNSVESSPTLNQNNFNSLNLQQKQQLLEQELEQLRAQQQQLFSRNNFAASNQVLSQTGFNQAINQNFNQLDPVFTEPDRSIVTKLATIDPNNLLAETAGPLLSRFMPSDAIFPVASPTLAKPKGSEDVSFVASISFDPLLEAGKLPKNAQILPSKEPTGFHRFVQLPKQSTVQSFVQPNQQHTPLNSNYLSTSNHLRREPDPQNQNRFLRQEVGTTNLGFNQQTFSIVPAQQPFPPKHELSYFPENYRFLGPSEIRPQILANLQNSNLLGNNVQQNRFSNAQNDNRFLKSNLLGTGSQSLNVQQSIQPFGSRPLISGAVPHFFANQRFLKANQNQVTNLNQPQTLTQSNRILRSNAESTYLSNPVVFQTPVLQNYKYSRPFGFSSTRLF